MGHAPEKVCTAVMEPEPEDAPRCEDASLIDDWHGVAYSTDLPPGAVVHRRLLGHDLALWRGPDGAVHAWHDRCPHRGAPLSGGCVVEGALQCPYHGWRFDGTTACTAIPAAPTQRPPARAHAFAYTACERYGLVWVTLGNPAHAVPTFAEWDDPTFRGFHVGPYEWAASGFRCIENFLDITHFPYVHPEVNGVPARPDPIDDYAVIESDHGLETSEIRVFQPYGDHRATPVLAGYSYRCERPLVAYFSKRVEVANGATRHPADWSPADRFCTLLVVHAIDEVSCTVRVALAINFGPELTQADIARRQDLVYDQDRAIVERQRPRRIPIDPRAEISHRTDKAGLAYRRWLGDLKIRYGTVST